MATYHECDACRARVPKRADLWAVAFERIDDGPARRVPDNARKVERFELRDRCKKRVYVAMTEAV